MSDLSREEYDEQSGAWAAMHMLSGSAPYEVAQRLGVHFRGRRGLQAMLARFCGTDELWRFQDPRGPDAKALLKPALATYCDKTGIAPGDPIRPGRQLLPLRQPKPKVAKPKPQLPPDTSEYGITKAEYLAALERLKAAKARRDAS
jgi:hypothetical protein